MTKKDYILIADTLKYCRPCKIAKPKGYEDRMEAWRGTVEELTKRLQAENTRFDRSRFLEACGV